MGRRDTKEVLYSEGNKKSQGAAAENMRVRERRAGRVDLVGGLGRSPGQETMEPATDERWHMGPPGGLTCRHTPAPRPH